MIPSMSSSLNHSWIISNIKGDHLLCGGSRCETKAPAGFGETSGGGQQTGQQGNQGDADEGNASSRDKLFNALTLGAGVVIAISFQQVDAAPYAERAAERHNEGLESADCRVEEIHIFTFPAVKAAFLKFLKK